MGLLDELRAEKERVRSLREQEESEIQRKEELYREVIRPQFKALFAFLQEVVEHINYIEPKITVNYRLPGNIQTGELKQQNYVLTTDSSDRMTEIWLRCNAVAKRPFMIPAETERIAAAMGEQLRQFGLTFAKRSASGSGIKCALLIEVIPSIPINFHFKVDKEKGGILLTVKNYAELGIIRKLMKTDEFGDQWLEEIGELILRRGDRIIRSELSDAERQRIKERLASDRAGSRRYGDEAATAKQRAKNAWDILFDKKK